MTVDLRRFHYGLEPVLRRWQWRLEALQLELGKLVQAVLRKETEVAALHERQAALGIAAARPLSGSVDLDQYRFCLAALVRLRAEIAATEAEAAALRRDRNAVRDKCRVQQQKVELIERHRESCLADFAVEEHRRGAVEADRDWLLGEAARQRPAIALFTSEVQQ
jgi:cell division protein FtsB